MSTPIDLQGWDTANVVSFDLINKMIRDQNATPTRFNPSASATLPHPQALTPFTYVDQYTENGQTQSLGSLQNIQFDHWQLIPGGDGRTLRVRCPFQGGTVTLPDETPLSLAPANGVPSYIDIEIDLQFQFNADTGLLITDNRKSVTVVGWSDTKTTGPVNTTLNPRVIDTSNSNVYSDTGAWKGASGGFLQQRSSNDPNAVARWTMNGLTANRVYEIAVTYGPTGEAGIAQFVIPGNSNPIVVDQSSLNPNDPSVFQTTENGTTVYWKRLGSFLATSLQQNVVLTPASSNSSKIILADAIRYAESQTFTANTSLKECREVFEDWLNDDGLKAFAPIFHQIQLNSLLDKNDYEWLAPTSAAYAVNDTGASPSTETSAFAVLCNTQNHTGGTASQVPAGILSAAPAGTNSALVISAEQFTSKFLLPSAKAMFPDQAVQDAGFRIGDNNRIVHSTKDLHWNSVAIPEGGTVDVKIPAGGLSLRVNNDHIEARFEGLTYNGTRLPFGGHEVITMSFTQTFQLTIVDVVNTDKKALEGHTLGIVDYDPNGKTDEQKYPGSPVLTNVSFSHALDSTAATADNIVTYVTAGLGALGIIGLVGSAGAALKSWSAARVAAARAGGAAAEVGTELRTLNVGSAVASDSGRASGTLPTTSQPGQYGEVALSPRTMGTRPPWGGNPNAFNPLSDNPGAGNLRQYDRVTISRPPVGRNHYEAAGSRINTGPYDDISSPLNRSQTFAEGGNPPADSSISSSAAGEQGGAVARPIDEALADRPIGGGSSTSSSSSRSNPRQISRRAPSRRQLAVTTEQLHTSNQNSGQMPVPQRQYNAPEWQPASSSSQPATAASSSAPSSSTSSNPPASEGLPTGMINIREATVNIPSRAKFAVCATLITSGVILGTAVGLGITKALGEKDGNDLSDDEKVKPIGLVATAFKVSQFPSVGVWSLVDVELRDGLVIYGNWS